jgi:hypothetical protein
MKMAEENGIDAIAINRKFVHGDERSRAAIDEYVDVSSDEMKASVESTPRTERIAAADELKMHADGPRGVMFCTRTLEPVRSFVPA